MDVERFELVDVQETIKHVGFVVITSQVMAPQQHVAVCAHKNERLWCCFVCSDIHKE